MPAAARPQVQVHGFSFEDFKNEDAMDSVNVKLPEVFVAPIRPDIVHFVHTNMAKNKRQAYGVSPGAGHQHSAASWGTGRAVSRIPRVSGGGTSRAGQAAFGNMCRKGRMFAPTRIWRKWHRKINQNQKRYAVASALAASALPSLVMARGHQIEEVPEIPLVVTNKMQGIQKTKVARAFLEEIGAYDDVERVEASRKIRPGRGKLRNRRHTQKVGPLIVFSEDEGVSKSFRNIRGVEVANVETLNLLQLAPGGHMGRFIVWSQAAFEKLNDIWGSTKRESTMKKGYKLPVNAVSMSDISRIINSNEIQSHPKLRVAKAPPTSKRPVKRNPLKNNGVMDALNPYAVEMRKTERAQREAAAKDRASILAKKRAAQKANAIQKKVNYAKVQYDYAVLTKADLDQKIASDEAERKAKIAEAEAAKKAEEEAEAQMLAEKEAAKKASAAAAEQKEPAAADDDDDDDDDDDE
mmetsp:Transcript_6838/g.12960  ORF Transcript_6838/g.12960 Transcript_6838/m.12960 type:complete len:466 (+) Transcript_6838:26-1423(+)